ncbi:MAG TPA: hypothetical protein VL334_19170 [Anaerolineae bacterium]|nr:hypothetical protein [Anaerolineae bacterium]
MNQAPLPTNYRIFLLTVWRDDSTAAEGAALRFSLHDPRSRQRRGFSELEGLLAFLEARLDASDIVNFGDANE